LGATVTNGGSTTSQRPGMKSGHRVWKGHPDGRLYGCGIEPLIVGSICLGGESIVGIDRNSAWV
jgi:hypothetical protein